MLNTSEEIFYKETMLEQEKSHNEFMDQTLEMKMD